MRTQTLTLGRTAALEREKEVIQRRAWKTWHHRIRWLFGVTQRFTYSEAGGRQHEKGQRETLPHQYT